MALLGILKYPDPFLKTKAKKVDSIDAGIKALIRDMTETMYQARGVGLAATQVGVDKRVVVLDVPQESDGERKERGKNLRALINPEIIGSSGSTKFEEGCLSIPGINADVVRASHLLVMALDKEGKAIEFEADGLLAIAVQHEIDHIDGILFIDRLSRLKRDLIKRKIKKALKAEERAL